MTKCGYSCNHPSFNFGMVIRRQSWGIDSEQGSEGTHPHINFFVGPKALL